MLSVSRRTFCFAVASTAALVLAGCGKESQAEVVKPEDRAVELIKLMYDGKFDDVMKLSDFRNVPKDTLELTKKRLKGMIVDYQHYGEQYKGVKAIVLKEPLNAEAVKAGRTTAKLTVAFGNGTDTFEAVRLILVDGDWKLDMEPRKLF